MKKNTMKRLGLLLTAMLVIGLLVSGCGGSSETKKPAGKTVRIGYVNWAEGVAMTHLAKAVMEDKMGYTVNITMADVAPVFTSVANGDYDVFMDAWLPVTHESYMKEYGDKLLDLGTSFQGAQIGIVVPDYVTIDSIEQMNTVKDKFGGQIIGIDSGAGIMMATDRAIADYGLNYKLLSGSGPAMTAALKDAVEKKEWIAVTGWNPHWKFASWPLKFLQDPKGSYGKTEDIHIVARKNIESDLPEAAQFFKNFKLDSQQLAGLMGSVENSANPLEGAKEWMKKNESVVNGWIPAK